MEFVIKISQFLLSLSLLIVLHELGHFIPAKLFKTRVEKFYLFFDIKYSLFKKKIGETVYGIGWLPLGGYVKISGMIDESMDKEQMAEEPKPWEFRSKPSWQRLIIMLGGVTVNFILAAIIYIFMTFGYGESDIAASSIKDGYMVENPLLKEFGLQTGDNILAINDNEIVNYSDLKKYFLEAQVITIERNGSKQKINLPEDFLGRLSSSKSRGFFELRTPFIISRVVDSSLNKKVDLKKGDLILSINGKELKYFDQLEESLTGLQDQTIEVELLRKGNKITRNLNVDKNGKLGIFNGGNLSDIESLGYFDIIEKQYTFGESIGVGLSRFKNQIGSYWMQLKLIFTPSTGVLNLLPIPALDGGHVMFLLYEMVSGRKPSDKFMEYAQMIGFFILIALVLFANGNDIFKAIFN